MHWETTKFIWLALLQYALYCRGLEPKLQYVQGNHKIDEKVGHSTGENTLGPNHPYFTKIWWLVFKEGCINRRKLVICSCLQKCIKQEHIQTVSQFYHLIYKVFTTVRKLKIGTGSSIIEIYLVLHIFLFFNCIFSPYLYCSYFTVFSTMSKHIYIYIWWGGKFHILCMRHCVN